MIGRINQGVGMSSQDECGVYGLGRERPQMPPCPNFNHRRSNAPVRFCPHCGEIVNAQRSPILCIATLHDIRRRGRSVFCFDCGARLITRAG